MANKTLLLAGTQETQRPNKWLWWKTEVQPFNEKLRARATKIRQAIQIAEALKVKGAHIWSWLHWLKVSDKHSKQLFKALATKQPLLKKIEDHINRQLPDLLWCHQPCQNYTKDSATQLELEVMGYSYCRLATLPVWLLEWERHFFWEDLWDIVACCWKEYGLLPPLPIDNQLWSWLSSSPRGSCSKWALQCQNCFRGIRSEALVSPYSGMVHRGSILRCIDGIQYPLQDGFQLIQKIGECTDYTVSSPFSFRISYKSWHGLSFTRGPPLILDWQSRLSDGLYFVCHHSEMVKHIFGNVIRIWQCSRVCSIFPVGYIFTKRLVLCLLFVPWGMIRCITSCWLRVPYR